MSRWQPPQALTPSALIAIDERAVCPGLQLFVPVFVVDHDDRRTVARAKALHRLNREHAGWIGLAGLDPELLLRAPRSRARHPASAHDSVVHTCNTYLPTGLRKNIT